MAHCRPARLTTVAAAVAAATSLLAAPAGAAIVTSGLVTPDPSSGFVAQGLDVGTTGPGAVTVNGGSTLISGRLTAGTQASGNGAVVVSGAGSSITTNIGVVGNFFNTNVGSQGIGSLSVLNGATFVNGIDDNNCQLRCRLFMSNGAGSDGTLLVQGAGSTLNTVGGVRVGWASLFTQAVAGFDYGQAGGASQGRATVEAGGQVSASFLDIGNRDLASEVTAAETASGSVVVDGAGSVWNLVRQAAQTGAQALLRMTNVAQTSASLTVRNGGVVRLDGSSAPTQLSGINLGNAAAADGSNSNAAITVTGPGSRLEFTGGNGFMNIGRGNGNVAQLTVSGGGVVTGVTEHALGFVSVGRGGATGSLTIDGAGSLMRLSAADAVGGGAFLHVGRFDVTAGTGSASIRNGGRLEIDDRTQVLSSGNQTGMMVGNSAGSLGTMNISGPGSTVLIAGSTGRTPFIGVGRDGGSGQLTISAGGRLEVSSEHTSVPDPNGYLPGDALFLTVGQRFAGGDGLPSVGVLNVTGAGSELVMSGAADRIIQVGRGDGGSGTLNISQGGTVRTLAVLVGDGAGATGTLNMNGGVLLVDGQRNGGPSPGGAGISIGRGDGGTGIANIGNGSVVVVNSTGVGGGIGVGGSTINPGGNGTLLVSGGSTVGVHGSGIAVTVGSQGSQNNAGFGTMVLAGAGTSMTVTGDNARVLAGNFDGSTGLIDVGSGATLTTTGLVGVAHNGSGPSGGTGLLVVNGTVNADQLFIAPGGVVVGNGTINAAVVNQGGIGPGNTPGRLTVNGAFDSDLGQIVLEVEALANGGFAVDELVFGDPARVLIGGADIVFRFLGNTDPNTFRDAGLFDLASFFKERDAAGGVSGLGDEHREWFTQASFSAASDRYEFRSFSFDPFTGATFDAVAIPEPGSLALLLLALPWLRGRRGAGAECPAMGSAHGMTRTGPHRRPPAGDA